MRRGELREVSFDVLLGLARHGLLSKVQFHWLYGWRYSLRWSERLLVAARKRGYVELVQHRARRLWLWYLTEAGFELAQMALPTGTGFRTLTPEQAEGPLQLHTLDVNEVGVRFVVAARERGHLGDECGPLAWTHEAHHSIQGIGRAQAVVADAVLRYAVTQPRTRVHTAFLEVDRASLDARELAWEILRYATLYDAPQSWQAQYGETFPRVLVVLSPSARAGRQQLEARMHTVVELAREDPVMRARAEHGEVLVYFTLLEHLQTRGPFARVWCPLADPERLVGWLEEV